MRIHDNRRVPEIISIPTSTFLPSFNWNLGINTRLSWTTSTVLGDRNSVQFDKNALIKDAINPATLTYAPRQVDIDNFNSYTSELRILHGYHVEI